MLLSYLSKPTRLKGFTLVELLVVVTILGILASIAVPTFFVQRKKATDASVKSDVKSIVAVMETAYIDDREYPMTLPDLAAAADPLEKSESDTEILIYIDTEVFDTYCILARNPSGTTAEGEYFSYASDGGGMKLPGEQNGACTPSAISSAEIAYQVP